MSSDITKQNSIHNSPTISDMLSTHYDQTMSLVPAYGHPIYNL